MSKSVITKTSTEKTKKQKNIRKVQVKIYIIKKDIIKIKKMWLTLKWVSLISLPVVYSMMYVLKNVKQIDFNFLLITDFFLLIIDLWSRMIFKLIFFDIKNKQLDNIRWAKKVTQNTKIVF